MTEEETDRIKLETINELSALRSKRTCLKAKAEGYQNEIFSARGIIEEVTSGNGRTITQALQPKRAGRPMPIW